MFPEIVDLLTEYETVTTHWSPKIVTQVNDQYIKVAKVFGQFVWHKHDDEDELFYIVKGTLKIEYQGGRVVSLPPGSMHVVPKGMLHHPVADEECWIVLMEPVGTKHTGDVISPLTKSIEQQIG